MNRKAQIATFMVLVVVVLILAIAATMLIGELGFQRIRLANIADSAVVSGASRFCRSLNQIRMIHSGMFLNHISMQTMLLVRVVWSSKLDAWAASAYNLQNGALLYFKARSTAKVAAKELRSSLYDIAFGGALIDEPEPFKESEVIYDASSGRVIGLDYTSYINRLNTVGNHFTLTFREFKNTEGDSWYTHPVLSYSWNKTVVGAFIPGKLSNFGVPDNSYDSYLIVSLQNAPTKVSVSPMPMIAIFFYLTGKPIPPILPGFIFNPFAWIRKISIDNNSFGLTITKSIPFRRLPFFSRDVILTHTNNLRIKGTVWSGYDFRMER